MFCSKCFKRFNALTSHSNLWRKTPLLSLFSDGEMEVQRLANLPKTHDVSVGQPEMEPEA